MDIPPASESPAGREAFTIGHSTHEPDVFVGLLLSHGVECVADIRAHPGSRRMPHFAREALAEALSREGIEYVHVPELGGRRTPVDRSPNDGWRKDGFRGYADHMATAEFDDGLRRLTTAASERPTAVMCAEALWWRCHRRLVSDRLTVDGWRVVHIGPRGEATVHELTPFAEVEPGRLTYPSPQGQLVDLAPNPARRDRLKD